jgi:hypothetical protein
VALEALYQHLSHRTPLPPYQRVVPYLVMRSNLDVVLDRLSVDRRDGVGEGPPQEEGAPLLHGRPIRPARTPRTRP